MFIIKYRTISIRNKYKRYAYCTKKMFIPCCILRSTQNPFPILSKSIVFERKNNFKRLALPNTKLYGVLCKIDYGLRRWGCSLLEKYCSRVYNTCKKIVFLFVFNIIYIIFQWGLEPFNFFVPTNEHFMSIDSYLHLLFQKKKNLRSISFSYR